jgi:hypothetical protein
MMGVVVLVFAGGVVLVSDESQRDLFDETYCLYR